jgi:hypothetical protein
MVKFAYPFEHQGNIHELSTENSQTLRVCRPMPEGIYNMAKDTNRLTTIFSEENPNDCTIV